MSRFPFGTVIRRAIVIVAAFVFVGVGVIVYLRMRAAAEVKSASFFEDASAVPAAFQRALGPEPPVVELAIEPDQVTASVVVSAQSAQQFTFRRDTGYVVAGPLESLPSRDEVAFSLSTVPFGALPDMITAGSADLASVPSRLVVQRPPGADLLRYRLFADDGARFVEIAPR